MKHFKTVLCCLIILAGTGFILTPEPLADKSKVKIEAPSGAVMGEEVVIVLHIFHEGNNFIHYTRQVNLFINDKPAKQWKHSRFDRPEKENFSVSFSHTAMENLKIKAEAFCNIHGSEGAAIKTIAVTADQSSSQ